MSFNSILEMAGVDSPSKGDDPTKQRPVAPRPVVPNTTGTSSGIKRKADGPLEQPSAKTQRQDIQPLKYSGTAAPRAASSVPGRPSSAPGIKTAELKSSTLKSETSIIAKKPTLSTDTSSTSKSSVRPPAPALSGPSAVKGSFQDIMNRAKALQETKLAKDRRFVNKATEVRKKEERKKLHGQHRSKSKSAPTSRSGSTEPTAQGKKPTSGNAIREKPKPEPMAYKGTARPTPSAMPSYKGTANLNTSKRPQKSGSGSSKGRHDSDKYGYGSGGRGRSAEYDDEEGYDSEEGYESSDMEAGILDIDEEEELALRQARKEDAEALRQENEMRRQKLLRKQNAIIGRR